MGACTANALKLDGRARRTRFSLGMLALVLTLVACGGMAPAEPFAAESSRASAPAPPATSAPPAPAPEVIVSKEVVKQVETTSGSARGGPDIASKIQASMVAQNRVIVHTGDLTLVVDDVAGGIDQVTGLSREYGGWVVSSNRKSRHSGSISIRVPAGSLDEVLGRLERIAIDVESRALTSQDVTDEFVDSKSRLKTLRATEQVHLEMLSRANDIEDALKVQDRLSQVQLQIEEMEGRINYLSEVAAFSLINVNLKLSTVKMRVDAGQDTAFKVGQRAQFRASFQPPPGIDEFTFGWDFGEGTTATGSRTAPVAGAQGERVTASASHLYTIEGDYIAEVKMVGKGNAGLADGSDTLIVTVTQVPAIEVFAGEDLVVEEGDNLELRASFTRPEELWDYQYRWNFGDGAPTETGSPEEGATRIETVHKFNDYRPNAYPVAFTMSAMSEAGKVSASGNFHVQVTESRGFIIGGWSAGNTGKTAVRALSVVGQALGTILIWLAVFSPVLLLIAGGVVGFRYLRRRFGGSAGRYLSGLGGGQLQGGTILEPGDSTQSDDGEYYEGLEARQQETSAEGVPGDQEDPVPGEPDTPQGEEPEDPTGQRTPPQTPQ